MQRLTVMLIIIVSVVASISGKPPLVYRTLLPDTRPSSIAIGYSNDISFVFDPVRGGISYIWTGPFLDLEPTWTGKIIQPAKILGKVFFRDATELPLRKGDPNAKSDFVFGGYDVDAESVTFYYHIEGSEIRQTVSALKGESSPGLHIAYTVADPEETYWLILSPQPRAEISSPDGARQGNYLCFQKKKSFSVEIRHE